MRRVIEGAFYVLCAGLILGILAHTLAEQRACDARRGLLVKTAGGYECIVVPGR